jgi:perosamine synthetase
MPIICNTEAEREGLREWLAQDGIETRTYFVPMHQQDHLRVYAGPERFPRAEYLGRCGLYLPLYPAMSAAEVLYVARSVRAWADRI